MSLVFSLGLAFRRQPSAPTLPVAPPVNTAAPAISGTAQVGQTLTASPGTWTNGPTGHLWQWQRSGTGIAGATGADYTLQAADIGAPVTVQVIATNAGGAGVPATSAATAPVTAAVPAFAHEVFAPMNTLTGYSKTSSFNYNATLNVAPPIVGASGAISSPLTGAPSFTIRRLAFPFVGGSAGDPANPARIKPTDMFVVAMEGPTVAGGYDPMLGVIGNMRLTMGSYSHQWNAAGGASPPGVAGETSGGKRFYGVRASSMKAGSWTGADISTQAPGNITLDVALTTTPIGQGTVKVGPIYRVTQAYKPIVVLTYDDWNPEQSTVIAPRLAERGLVGSAYALAGAIGAGRMSLAQGLALRAAGWSINMDCHPVGWPVHQWGSVADAIAGMNGTAAILQGNGLSSADDTRHVCYSFGPNSYVGSAGTLATATCTANGTAVLTITSGNFWGTHPMRGAHVKGAGIPAGTRVVGATDTTVTLDRTIPAGTVTVRFAARVTGGGFGLACVANGTTKITGIVTHAIVPGMVMQGRDVPPGTTVVSVDVESTTVSGEITVSNAVPTGTVWCSFYIADGEWNAGRFAQAALAAGYRTARRTKSLSAGICTQFGLPADHGMELDALDGENASSSLMIANLQRCINDNLDSLMLSHGNSADMTSHVALYDFIKARVDAGELQCMNLTTWHNTVSARSGPA